MSTPQQDSAAASSATREHLAPGVVVDERYEIVDFIGAGGFATVYRAKHVHMEREVALKLLNPPQHVIGRFADDEYQTRFLREAQAAASVAHPNVVTIHDFGFAPVGPYIVMELLEGYDLAVELTTNGPMPPQHVVDLLTPCLEALGEGHERNVIHRDIKPTNLFLARPGTRREALVILDFGIAHLAGGVDEAELEPSTEAPRVFLGTPAYLAPEWLKDHTLTPALDVYQMGLIAVEMLTGERVVNAYGLYGCMAVHASGRLNIPHWLDTSPLGPIIRTATALDYKARYRNGQAFAEALHEVDLSEMVSPLCEDVGGDTLRERAIKVLDSGAHVYVADQVTGTGVAVQGDPHAVHDTDRLSEKLLERVVNEPLSYSDLETLAGPNSGISASLMLELDHVVGADRRKRGIVVLVVVGIVLALVATLAVVFISTEAPVEDAPQATPRQIAKSVTPTLVTAMRMGTVGLAVAERYTLPEPEPEPVKKVPARIDAQIVEFRVNPPQTAIYRGDVLLGNSPVSLPFYEQGEVELELRMLGYKPLRLAIHPQNGMVIERALSRRKKKPTRTMQIAP